ncbi:hypothetical protein LCGC14_1618990 [marine sediment metagenome]|uniref:Uncharacterized protein n=1 Tax=marine sediment metagenome TaxID=412755 RepID=A0A0F9I6D2_9ZZZZ
MDITGFFNGVIVLGLILYFMMLLFRDLWRANKENKRISVIAGSMTKHRWLLKLGMREHAVYFNAFGMRSRSYSPFKWY